MNLLINNDLKNYRIIYLMNTNLTCFICRDSEPIMYKICECVDSTICIDCYNIESTQKMEKCGICRKNYEFDYTKNSKKYIKAICIEFGSQCIIFFCELFPILYLYFYLKHDYLTEVFLIYGLFCITIGNLANYHFLNTIIENPLIRLNILSVYIPIKCLYTIIVFLLIFYLNDIGKLYIYFGFILGVLYTAPLLFFSTIFFITIFKNILNRININTSNKHIKIRSTIYQTLSDYSIDNV